MKTLTIEKGSDLRSAARRRCTPATAKLAVPAKPAITDRTVAALERQMAEFQRTFTVRYEW
jgi:hypothetical protein